MASAQLISTDSHAKDAAFSSDTATTITIGTRTSKLALVQTDIVVASLKAAFPNYTYKVEGMVPLGDKDKLTALYNFNAKSLWTSELEAELSLGKLDMIVHSLKDMPTQLPEGLILGAVFPREDPRDALVLKPSRLPAESDSKKPLSADEILSSLPAGSVVGTSSLRRIAQMKKRYPHLKFADVRGNVPTRLRKLDDPSSFTDQVVPDYAAIVIAVAGLVRLGLGHRITAYLSASDGGMMHAVGQGAIGVETREGDERVRALLEKLGCWKTERACLAERSLMRTLEGGCSVPLGVETTWENDDMLKLAASVVSVEGDESVEAEAKMCVRTKEAAEDLGKEVARIMIEKGAAKILDKITMNRKIIAEQHKA
ncbi:porphobilinogen deaminase [Verruconis gallopava]|uniref:Porphobilinogen deaminase n=1 Tax=Verruconis gallopava TaxID=253628 RepID=A0A0D2AAP7_9PEZI|nr:porphobilinogen deaminase [Verruconis gallopava]KIW03660.1 porphobilinogen deaminase [Verruconis gallopava]